MSHRGTRPRLSRLERAAYHEAGHAVVACELHRRFEYVTIVPTDGSRGSVRPTPLRNFQPDGILDRRTCALVQREVMWFVAGSIAEKLHTGRGDWKVGARGDIHEAFNLAEYATSSDEEAGAYVGWLRERTMNMLQQPILWASVEALATALLEQKTIRWRAARRIIREAKEAHIRQSLDGPSPQDVPDS